MPWSACSRCNRQHHHLTGSIAKPCQCEPFQIRFRDEDAGILFAMDAEEAALEWAQSYNEEGDYDMMRPGNESIMVEVEDGVDNYRQFEVTAEASINYEAVEL